MAYCDYSFESVQKTFGIEGRWEEVFPPPPPLPVPEWLRLYLGRSVRQSLLSEKSRGELLVMPILLASQELSRDRFAIFSGQSLIAAPEQGLTGECDFILSLSPPMPVLTAPVITLVEAKKHDLEAGIGQCVAQMIGARLYNEQHEKPLKNIYGCVTSGETWLFLRMENSTVLIDTHRYYIDNVGSILAAIQVITTPLGSEG